MNNFVKFALERGGRLVPILIPAEHTNGLGLMNPSILDDGDKLIVNLRQVNYTFYHSEKNLFNHPYGPLTYIHPEDDLKLRTWNWYLEYDKNTLDQIRYNKINTSKFPDQELWEFIGLEDVRLVRWDGDLWTTGVRRDTTTIGQGRMELCKLEVTDTDVIETERYRIEALDPESYCEKNWMPVLDMPWHYIKWTNPTELVEVDIKTLSSKLIKQSNIAPGRTDLRGGSQLIPWKDGYFTVTHELEFFQSETGRKDAIYDHRFVLWDKNFNIVKMSKSFSFLDGQVEFAVGMCHWKNGFLITFGFQDNSAYILYVTYDAMEKFLNA
jgi:hypothetical protein